MQRGRVQDNPDNNLLLKRKKDKKRKERKKRNTHTHKNLRFWNDLVICTLI